jgi:hypothetical protein
MFDGGGGRLEIAKSGHQIMVVAAPEGPLANRKRLYGFP